jgi:hypothetical protein
VDRIVTAELPDEKEEPELWHTVTTSMLHAPCGPANPNRPCMVEIHGRKVCRFRFPKAYQDETTFDEDSYPTYRRRDDGRFYRDFRTGHIYTNRDVVPYNRWLLRKYDAHINVEVASSITSVKYLYKYIYKGQTRSVFQVSEDEAVSVDEIQEYLDGRYIGPAEACWRLLEFPITNHKPTVKVLDVHLEGEEMILFNDYDNPSDFLDNPKKSTLNEFFQYCLANPVQAQDLLYIDAPSKLVWKDASGWQPRVGRGADAVGRMRHVPPSAGEVSLKAIES